MAKFQNFHVAQDNRPATITYRRFKRNAAAVLRAEGVTLETTMTSANYALRGNDISHMTGADYDWTLFSDTNSDRDGKWLGSVSAVDTSSTQLKIFFEPSVSDYDAQKFITNSSGSFYAYGWPVSDDTTLGDTWTLSSSRMRVSELVIDLTKAPEAEYKYAVMANIDLSCSYGMHPYYAECQVIKGRKDKAGKDPRSAVNQASDGYKQSPESYGRTVFFSPVKNRQDHWQAVFPVTLKGGEFYRIPIVVGTYEKYYSWRGGTTESAGISRGSGDTGGDNNSGDGWDFPPLEGATITAQNAKVHAIRIDNATYAEVSDGKEPSVGSTGTPTGFEVYGGAHDKSDYTNFAKEDDGIVRKLEIDDTSMKGGDYLVLFSATLSNNDSENYSGNDRPLTTKVYFGKTTYWSSYNVHSPLIENAEIKWPGASSPPYSGWNQASSGSTFAELDQVSIGYAGIVHFRSEDHADWSGSTLKEELTFGIGGDAKTPSVKNYYICAIKLSDLGENIDSLGNISQPAFDSFNSLSSPQDGHMDASISSENQRANFKEVKPPEGAEDIYAEDAVDHLDVSTAPRFNTTFKMVYTPDSLLDSNTNNSSPPNEPTGNIADDNETVVRWANLVHDTDYHLEQTTAGRQGKSKHNRINGYAALDMKRQSASVGGVQYDMSGDIVLNGDSTNFTNCIWWVVRFRRPTESSGALYQDLDNDSRSQQSGDENFYLSRTQGGSIESGSGYSNAGSNNLSDWRIKRGLGSSDTLYEQMIWYTDGKAHTLTYAQGLREGWADQEWRVICSRRISKTQCELYINGRLMGVSTKFVHDSNGNNSGNYPDRIGRIGAYTDSSVGELEMAEMAVVDGETTEEEVAYHNQRLIDKYNINKYSDQRGFSSDQKYADVSWDTSITADNNRFRGDTYPETGNYLELISHSGAEIEDRKDDTVVVTGASGSPTVDFATKEYGIYSSTSGQVHDSFYYAVDVRHRGSNIGGHGKFSTSKSSDDGFLGCRDYGYIHIFAIRDNEFTASGLGMTTSEFNAISVGDIFEITDDTNGFKDVTYSDTYDIASDSETTTHIGGRIEVEIVEKLAKNSTLDGNDGSAVTLPNVDGDAASSIMISGSAGANHTSVFTFKVLRTYSDRDTLPFRAPRTIGQNVLTYTHSGTSYTTDFATAGSTARFRKIRAAHRSPEIRPRFGDSNSNYSSRRPVYPPLDDSEYSMIYRSTGFRESATGPAKGASLIDYTHWSAGMTMPPSGYSLNGTSSENAMVTDVGPFGTTHAVWASPGNDSASNPDGGWNGHVFSIDNGKLYRFSVWVRRKVLGDGKFYFGLRSYDEDGSDIGLYTHAYSTTYQEDTSNISTKSDGTPRFPAKNYYLDEGVWDDDVNEWYLVVGHVHPHDATNYGDHADSGWYKAGSTTKVHGGHGWAEAWTAAADGHPGWSDARWLPTATQAYHRSYLYYSTVTTTEQQWAYPRVDLVDGTEPSISDLVNNTAPTANGTTVQQWIDTSGRSGLNSLETSGDADNKYHFTQTNNLNAASTTTGPTGTVAGALQFSATDNTNSGKAYSLQAGINGNDADMLLTDQAMISWVINFDKQSSTWRHPLAGHTGDSGANNIIYFESRDADGNGTLVFHNFGQIGSAGVQHEVRCEVTIPPDSWHTITFIQEDEGALTGKDGRRVRFFVDGYEKVSTITTEGQTNSAAQAKWEHLGKMNGWFLSAKIADIRVRSARSTASPAITSAGTDAEQQAVEMDLADTYDITTHRLHSSKYAAEPTIPNTPAGSTLLFHLKPDIEDMEIHRTAGGTNAISAHGSATFDSNTPVLSSEVSSATVARWYDANDTSYTGGGVLNFLNTNASTRPDFVTNVCNGYPGVKFAAGDTLSSSQNNQGSNSNLLGGTAKASGVNLFMVVKPTKHHNTGVIACCQGINVGLGTPTSGTEYAYDSSAGAQATNPSNFTYGSMGWGDIAQNVELGNGSTLIVAHSKTNNTTRDAYQYNHRPESNTDKMNSAFTQSWHSTIDTAKWAPFNGVPVLHPQAYVISLNYNAAGEPIVRLNGEIVMDYTADPSGRQKYTDSMFSTTVGMLRDWHLGEGSETNGLVTFDGYILEVAAYTKDTSGMTESEHLNIVDYMLDKYNIHSASRGSYHNYETPMGRGASGAMISGSTPGFWINSGFRTAGSRASLRLEARMPDETRERGLSVIKVHEPSYAWLKYNEPEIEVRDDTPVTILVESEKSLIIKRSWESVSGSPSYYTAYVDEGHEVSRVLVNGADAVRKKAVSDFPATYGISWTWDSSSKTVSVLMDNATANPNTDDYTVSVVLKGYYSREAENIAELPMPTETTSTTKSPTTSDDSTIFKSVYPDIATEGQRVVPYEPRLRAVPGYSQEMQATRGDLSVTSSYGAVDLAAGDGEFDADMAQKIFEGLTTKVYMGHSSLDARKDSFDILFEGRQGLPGLSKEVFNFGLFDAAIGFNDALESAVFEVNADDLSNGIEKWGGADYQLYFGRNYRVPAERVTHAQLSKGNTVPGAGEMALFKVCNHFFTLLDNADGDTTVKGVYLNQTDNVPFQITAADTDNSGFSAADINSQIVTDASLRKAGLIGIKLDNNFLDVRGGTNIPTTAYDTIVTAGTIYLDIEGVSVPNLESDGLAETIAYRDKIDTPGKCYRYLFENFPISKDEENGFYSTTTTSSYTPTVLDDTRLASSSNDYSFTVDTGTDFSQFDQHKGTRVLLSQVISSDTDESRYLHGVVVKTDPSSYRIWVQPQFVANDVRLDYLVTGKVVDYYTNTAKSADAFTSGSKLLVYEKFIGLPEDKINYNSFREMDKVYRLKQDTNKKAIRAVRFPVPIQAGFFVPTTGSLQSALSEVGKQFFSFYYMDKSGRAVADVPDIRRKNLLSNPGFEKSNLIASRNDAASDDTTQTLTSATSIIKIGNPWSQKNYAAITNNSLSNDFLYTGKQSAIVNSGTDKGFFEQAVPLGPGKYVFTAVIAAGATGSSAETALSVVLPDGDTPEIFSNTITPSGRDWQRVSLSFEVAAKGSGTTLLRIYPNSTSKLSGANATAIRVDDCELYEVAAFADEHTSDYFPVDLEEENYYETKVSFAKTPFLPAGSGYKIVDDINAKSAGLASSESRASLESAGRLNLQEVNAREGHDALEIAAKATDYYGRMRARMVFRLLEFDKIPEVGDMLYANSGQRSLEAADDYPLWHISSVDYQATQNANEVTVEALRHIDPVSDRSTVSGSGLPLGAILLCTESACPTGFTLVEGYERQFIGQPQAGEQLSSDEKGNWVHTHLAEHNHTIDNHTHTETVSQYGSISYGSLSSNVDLGAYEAPISSGAGTVNQIGASSPNHIHSPSSVDVATGNPISSSVGTDSQNLDYAVNTASYVTVLLCRRSGDFVEVDNPSQVTDNIPPTVTFGWESASAPANYVANTAMQGSENLLPQVRGGYAAALSSISITNVTAGVFDLAAPSDPNSLFCVYVSASDALYFEPRRLVTASDGSGNQIMLMVTAVASAAGLLVVYKVNGVEFDTAYTNANTKFDYTGFPAAGWTISSPADAPGTKILLRGYHSHGSDKSNSYVILDGHTHSMSHRHAGGPTSTVLGEHSTGSGYITTYNSGKDLNLGKSQNEHSSFGAVGNLPILFGSGQVDCHTNQMATAADYEILTEQHSWDSSSGHNNVDWNGNGTTADDITDWVAAPNVGGTALSPYNHTHSIIPQGGRLISKTSSTATGTGGTSSTNFGANRMSPPSYLLNWIKTDVVGGGNNNSKTSEIPSGAIIFTDGASCPTGYTSLTIASGLLIGSQSSGAAATSWGEHAHEISASAHSGVAHNHGYLHAGSTGRAVLPTSTAPKYRNSANNADWGGTYKYFNSFNDGDGVGADTGSQTISSPILFPVDINYAIEEPFSGATTTFNASSSGFAGFVTVGEVSGSNHNVATSSASSHFHRQLTNTNNANISLAATNFTTQSKSGDDLKPRYKELLACKKL